LKNIKGKLKTIWEDIVLSDTNMYEEAENKLNTGGHVQNITNVEREMYNYTGSAWSHRSGNKMLKGKFGAVPGKRSIDSLQKMAVLGTSHIIREA